MESKKVGIVGAGVTGLLACKHCMEKGLNPIVFEAQSDVGGVWSKTLESTKLQTPKTYYQFSDFPWPSSVNDTFPYHNQVLDYLKSYASHFNLLPRIKFNTNVIDVHYSGPSDFQDHYFDSWDLWGGSGEPFSQEAKWNVTIQNNSSSSAPTEVYQVDFVILCIGNFSGLANVPEFPKNKGPEIFRGVVMHAMDFAAMDDKAAAQLITGKRITVVGSQKSALDLASQVASRNGTDQPCTLLLREAHWMIPESFTAFTFKGFNRFSELMVHKPHEGFFQWLLTLFLSPLLWTFSKMVETYLKMVYPMKKYNMVPSYSLVEHIFSCGTAVTPPNFYDKVREGSLILKKAREFRFSENGLILDDGEKDETLVASEIVIFAIGYKPDEKLKNIFSLAYFQKCIIASSAPFYRECIHPRIPNLAIPGYADSPANIYTTGMKCRRLAHFLAGKYFKLPSIREMEQDVILWEKFKRRYAGSNYKRHCASALLQIYANDQLCYNMGYNPIRKSCFFSNFFAPYGPADYNFQSPDYNIHHECP